MKKEKIVGFLLFTCGIIYLSIFVYLLNSRLEILLEHTDNSTNGITILRIITNYHKTIFMGILGIFSGVLLLKGKYMGWITGIIFWSSILINLTIASVIIKDEVLTDLEFTIRISLGLVLLSLVLLLLNKYFLDKHNPKIYSWIIISISIILSKYNFW